MTDIHARKCRHSMSCSAALFLGDVIVVLRVAVKAPMVSKRLVSAPARSKEARERPLHAHMGLVA
jgi:hypothetical protein